MDVLVPAVESVEGDGNIGACTFDDEGAVATEDVFEVFGVPEPRREHRVDEVGAGLWWGVGHWKGSGLGRFTRRATWTSSRLSDRIASAK